MNPIVAGVSFHNAPLKVRERLTVAHDLLPDVLARFARDVAPGVVLSTCNRAEFYTLAKGPEASARLSRFLETEFDVPRGVLEASLYVYQGDTCVRHLFRVAAGLDSMVVGETEVLGQVRESFAAAAEAGTARGLLLRLFHQAFHVGRRVRRETDISRNAISVSGLCVHVARRTFRQVEGLRIAVIGAGEAGRLAVQALRFSGAGEVTVVNRTLARGQETAASLGGVAASFDDLDEVLSNVDVVVSATGATGHVLTRDTLAGAIANRADARPLLVVDLAVPRDVEPAARELRGIAMFDMDDLDALAETNRKDRSEAAEKAEAIVDEEVALFGTWLRSLGAMPTVAELRGRAEQVRRAELERALRRLGGLSPEQQEHVDSLTQAVVNRVLHDLTVTLKDQRDPLHLEVVRELFKLDEHP